METAKTIGRYLILRSLGKGGMGEVFLAYDPICCRQIALKAIRADITKLKGIHRRFLREAQLAAQLTHPAVIPIYEIHREESQVYYTMPYVEGETLKAILERARQTSEVSNGSIASLMPAFVGVCQAIAYAHSKQILHCDLKPGNIMIGSFGQVVILDWGLARPLGTAGPQEQRPAAGTLSFMAPELVLGQQPTVQTDVYALGSTLYQLLALRPPFRRNAFKELRKQLQQSDFEEPWVDPAEAAPYRDVPPALARIARRCLEANPQKRYQNVGQLLHDLEAYMEGRPEWLQVASLRFDRLEDWEFHEHILLSEHAAVTRALEGAEWVGLMVSRKSMGDNLRVKTQIRLGFESQGIGLLINVPESSLRHHLTDGLCLWLHPDRQRGAKLLRSGVEVMDVPDVYLPPGQPVEVLLQKSDNRLQVFFDGIEQFSFVATFPIVGTHVGVLYRDSDFEMGEIEVSVGGLTAQVNCLAVPDALLACRLFDRALAEYRRIGSSFVGRAEGREGMFRAGICLLEKRAFQEALAEFEKLRRTPGAPLEYLGKAIVYQRLGDVDEETKCLELALRKYADHPLFHLLEEQVICRMHESAQRNRRATYRLLFIALRLLPRVLGQSHIQRLMKRVRDHWEVLPWISYQFEDRLHMALQLGFWLNQPYALEELLQQCTVPEIATDGYCCLLHLGHEEMVPASVMESSDPRIANYRAQKAIDEGQPQLAVAAPDETIALAARLWVGDLTEPQPTERNVVPYGCWLLATQGIQTGRAYFSKFLIHEPYPRTWTLLAHYLLRGPEFRHTWRRRAFWWERQQLYRQLALYYHCLRDETRSQRYQHLARTQREPTGL